MPTFKRFISAVEAAEQIMKEWNDDKNNTVYMVILSPDNVDLLTDDEEVQDDDAMIDNALPSDVCVKVLVQTIFLNRENNDDE